MAIANTSISAGAAVEGPILIPETSWLKTPAAGVNRRIVGANNDDRNIYPGKQQVIRQDKKSVGHFKS